MREQLNFRQKDIQSARRDERAEITAKETMVLQSMIQDGELTTQQLESFLERMKELDEKK
jgi:hypothetical protein